RRVYVAGSTPTPDAGFMAQAARRLTDAVDGFLTGHRVLICDRDRKWTEGFRRIIHDAGVQIVLTPVQAPNAKGCASYCTSSVGIEGDWRVGRLRGAEGPEGRFACVAYRVVRPGRFEQALPLVVVDMGLEQAGAAPELDRGGRHVKSLRHLGLVQHARRAEPI